MSALTRCSRFSCILHRAIYCSRRPVVVSCSTWNTVVKDVQKPPKLLRSISHQPVLTRCFTVSAEKTVPDASSSKQNHNVEYSENFPASPFWKMYNFRQELGPDYNFESMCQKMYYHYAGREDIQPWKLFAFYSLVDQKTSFKPEEVLLVTRSVGVWNRTLTNDEKVQWMNYFTDKFSSLGVRLDDVYFNQILNTYLLHWIPFSPVEFLSTMEKHGVTPNGSTLDRFVVAYCRNGDIKSASQVLEHMKACDYPISHRSYAALVYGNFIAGDKETAMTLFRDTVKVGFELDAFPYTHAINGLAMTGDLEGVKEMVKEFQNEFGGLSEAVLCYLLQRIAGTENKQMFDYFLELLATEKGYYYNEASNALPVILRQGNGDLAYQLFMGLSDPMGTLFYKGIINAEMPVDQTLHFAKRLQQDKVRNSSLLNYYSVAIIKGRYDKALEILPHMAAEGTNWRPQEVWPLIQYFSITKDLDGLKTVIPYLVPESVTISRYLREAMQSFGVEMTQYEQIMKEHCKFTEGQVNACLLHYCLKTKGLEAASELVKTFNTLEDINDIWPLNAGYLLRTLNDQNWEMVGEILFSAVNLPVNEVERFVRRVIDFGAEVEKLKSLLLEKGVMMREDSIPSVLKEILSEQELKQIVRPFYSLEMLKNMPYKTLKTLESVFGHQFFYKVVFLHKAFAKKDWPAFEKTLGSIDVSKITNPFVLSQIAVFYSSEKQTIDNCLETLEQLKRIKRTKLSMPSFNYVKLVQNLCRYDRHAEANQLLKEVQCDERGDYKYGLDSGLFDMKQTEENLNLARELLYGLSNSGCLNCLNKQKVFQDYWQFVVKSGNMTTVFDEFEMLRNRFNFTNQSLVSVFCNVIETNDRAELQAAYDKLAEVIIEQRLLLHLAAAFLECGFKDKAKKVLATPGLRIQANTADSVINMWVNDRKYDLSEEFCKLIEYLPGTFTRADTLFIKLKVMCSQTNPDVDACIQFFETKFDEEGVTPRQNQVNYFATFLNRQHRPLPLSIRPIDDETDVSNPMGTKTPRVTKTPKVTKKTVEETTTTEANVSTSDGMLPNRSIEQWQTMLKEQPDSLDEILNSSDEMNLKSKTRLLVAGLLNGDTELALKIKKAMYPEERVTHMHNAAKRLKDKKYRSMVDPWINFVKIMDDKTSALRVGIVSTGTVSQHDTMEKLYEMAKEQGLNMEGIAASLKRSEQRSKFIEFITRFENDYEQKERQLTWEPTSTWSIPSLTEKKTTDSIAEKEPTTTASSESIDTNTDSVVMDNSSEVINDTAVDINVENEADIGMQDKATVVNDEDSTTKATVVNNEESTDSNK